MFKWDSDGAVKALGSERCVVCEKKKPIEVVLTIHGGKEDLHLPCCSHECMEIAVVVMMEETAFMN